MVSKFQNQLPKFLKFINVSFQLIIPVKYFSLIFSFNFLTKINLKYFNHISCIMLKFENVNPTKLFKKIISILGISYRQTPIKVYKTCSSTALTLTFTFSKYVSIESHNPFPQNPAE